MFEKFIKFLQSFFFISPENKEKRQIQRYAKMLRRSNPPVLEAKADNITAKFGYYLHSTLRPIVRLIPSFREVFNEKNQGTNFYKYLISQKISKEILDELDKFQDEQSILTMIREKNLSKEVALQIMSELLKEYKDFALGSTKSSIDAAFNQISKLSRIRKFNPVPFFTNSIRILTYSNDENF